MFQLSISSTFRKILTCFSFVLLSLPLWAQTSLLLEAPQATVLATNFKSDASGATIDLSSISLPIKSLAITGQITLLSDKGYARILLSDKSGLDYLVWEANSLTAEGSSVSLKNACEETQQLPGVLPQGIRIELSQASVEISKLHYLTQAQGNMREDWDDSLKFRQAAEKAALLNAQIQKKGLKWVAGVTYLSLLSYEQKKALFAGKVPDLQGAEYYKGGILVVGDAPTRNAQTRLESSPYVPAFDWRNRHGQFWPTSIKDQNPCASCWAYTCVASTETFVNLYYNRHINLDLSEQDLISCSGAGTCANGGYMGDAFRYIQNTGVVNEACYPNNYSDSPCNQKCSSPQERIKFANHVQHNYDRTEDQLKAAVIQGPVPAALASWSHTMELVGYKTIQAGDVYATSTSSSHGLAVQPGDPLIGSTLWIFKNSWGTYSGDNGYYYVVTEMTNIEMYQLQGPVTSLNYPASYVQCTDNDGDGYYFWGLGAKPAHCPPSPAQADGDDSNPNLGPMDQYGYCQVINGPFTLSLQAESQTWGQAVTETTNAGYTGSSYVNTNNVVGSWVEFSVNVPSAGSYACSLRYANSGTDRPANILVNGSNVFPASSFPSTGAWTTWSFKTFNVTLASGINTIRFVATTSSGTANIDRLDVTGSQQPTQYTLTTSGTNGTISLSPAGGTYASGTVVTLTATPNSGYTFSGWSGALTGTANPITITMNSNKTVSATFSPISSQYTLTTSASNGSIQLSPAGGTYASGTVVTLTAVPQSGYQFSAWGGALSGSTNPTTITMNGNKSVSASFTTATPTTQFCIEAESASGQSTFAPYVVQSNANASGGSYIVVPNGTGNQSSPPATSIANYNFNVTTAGSYNIWVRIQAPTSNDNNCYIRTDATSFESWTPGTYTSWTWKKWTSKTFTTGSHSLSIARNRDGLMIDKIIVTQSSSTPSGLGCTSGATFGSGEASFTTESVNTSFALGPNPSSGVVNITVQLAAQGMLTLEVYNSLGEKKATIASESVTEGNHLFSYDASDLAPGAYFVKLSDGVNVHTKTLIRK